MKLNSRIYGDPSHPRILLLHGLLGSLRNWHSTAIELSSRLHVMSLDLRNHGESPHHPVHTLDAMCADVESWLDEEEVESAFVLGHSMGGKVAMRLACRTPHRVQGLIVIDISPKSYPKGSIELSAMRALDLSILKNRRQADDLLSTAIPDVRHRQFLLTNLGFESGRGFHWKANLDALHEDLDAIRESPLNNHDVYEGASHLIKGGESPYVSEDDRPLFEKHFTQLRWTVLSESGHNPHMDNRDKLIPLIFESCGVS